MTRTCGRTALGERALGSGGAGRIRRRAALLALFLLPHGAAAEPPGVLGVARDAGANETPVLLVVAGVGGTPEHRERFSGWAAELCTAAINAPGTLRVRVLLERLPEVRDATDPCSPSGRSTQEELAREIGSVGDGAGLVLVLIGHGSGGPNPRFQLPGPDLAPERLSEMLDRAAAGPVTVAQLASASGAFLPALAAPGRVVFAAARANQTNETRFARHFLAAFRGDDADRNKDGRLSALEAFDFARLGVEREYEQEGLLRTEHALLDDNGDGVGSLVPETAPGSDGVLAARRPLLVLTREAIAADAGNPEVQRLVAERDALAARVDALREVREGMEEAAYFAELEALLLQVAELSERIAALREPPP